jgi:AraC-like DNA-binding protein
MFYTHMNQHETDDQAYLLRRDPAVISRPGPLQYLTEEDAVRMKAGLERLFREQKPYLQPGYSLRAMARALARPLYQVSAFINHEYGMNFNNLINRQRIEHALQLMDNGEADQLNFSGLASECGFNNRNSFTSAFKKFAGRTPSGYFRSRKGAES